MLVTLLGIVTLVRLVQSENASLPMLVTLLGIVTLVRLVQPKNASSPMLVTGRPLIVLGMVTAPPEPVYPVMVIVPSSLIVYVYGTGGYSAVGQPPNVVPQPVVPAR